MNVKALFIYIIVASIFFLLLSVTGCQDCILNVEDDNKYEWQKYMNEEEFSQLEQGMSYMEVVKIAGGAGTEIEPNVYEWQDEILMTQGYIVYFEEDQLIKTEVIEKRGSSTR